MTVEQGRAAIVKLEACVKDVIAADPKTIRAFSSEAQRLAAKIRRTLTDVFGLNSPEYGRAVVAPSSFIPRPFPPRREVIQWAAAFAAGRDLAVRNLQAEIDRLKEGGPEREAATRRTRPWTGLKICPYARRVRVGAATAERDRAR